MSTEYANMTTLPTDLLCRLVAAIETPDDLTDQDIAELLDDAAQWLDDDEGES